MTTYHQTASSSLGLPAQSYVYGFISNLEGNSVPHHLAVVSSDDSVRIFDTNTLQAWIIGGALPAVGNGVTAAAMYGRAGHDNPTIFAAGRDGFVRGWDPRTGTKAVELQTPKRQPLSALTCSGEFHAVVAGTELEGNPPGEANVFGWDVRKPGDIMLRYAESHADTISELQFAPPGSGLPPNYLLSASTDGLVTLFDTGIADEDDAVFQVINHQSAVHHSGFLGQAIFALGTDETLSFYSKSDSPVELKDVHLGDVREKLQCNYVVNVIQAAEEPLLACGKHGEGSAQQYLDLIRLEAPSNANPLFWVPNPDNSIRLLGAHGPEIVRDVVSFERPKVIFTCGEDCMVRLWKESVEEPTGPVARKRRSSPGAQKMGKRSKPHIGDLSQS